MCVCVCVCVCACVCARVCESERERDCGLIMLYKCASTLLHFSLTRVAPDNSRALTANRDVLRPQP